MGSTESHVEVVGQGIARSYRDTCVQHALTYNVIDKERADSLNKLSMENMADISAVTEAIIEDIVKVSEARGLSQSEHNALVAKVLPDPFAVIALLDPGANS